MAKTFPIIIEVEEIALGPVLRKLNEMPGIAKLHLDLGRGGEGAGKEKLASAAAQQTPKGRRETLIKLLLDGPKTTTELAAAMGEPKDRIQNLLYIMRKEGLTGSAGNAMHQLAAKAAAHLGKAKALPAPVAKAPSGRAAFGSGPIVLRAALESGPLPTVEIRKYMAENGMSPKGVSGLLVRAKRDGLIKKNGHGYELTAKGLKVEVSANG